MIYTSRMEASITPFLPAYLSSWSKLPGIHLLGRPYIITDQTWDPESKGIWNVDFSIQAFTESEGMPAGVGMGIEWDNPLFTTPGQCPVYSITTQCIFLEKKGKAHANMRSADLQVHLADSIWWEWKRKTSLECGFRGSDLWVMALFGGDWRDTERRRRQKKTRNGMPTITFCFVKCLDCAPCFKLLFGFLNLFSYHSSMDLQGSNTTIHLSSKISYSKFTEA